MPDPFRSFYRSNPPDLAGITDLPHRHFRFLLPRGSFFKVHDRIRNAATLQAWLVRYRPVDVYYSTSCWLAPENVGRRERTPLSDNIFLSADIVFDIDRSPFSLSNLEKARKDTLRIISFCDDRNIPVKYIAFSGSKGFHVIGADMHRYRDPDPLAREDMAKAVRKEIISGVSDEGIPFDAKITGDTRRIIRVPGTINSKTGYVCTIIGRNELARPVSEILNKIPNVSAWTTPVTGGDERRHGRIPGIVSWLRNRLWEPREQHSPFTYATWLINAVPGIDRQIPFFAYPPRRSQEKIEAELTGLQEQYKLSDVYLFSSDAGISAFCLRTFPLRRLEKIIRASGSTNYAAILKYKQLFFRIGEKRDELQRVVAGAPEFKKTLYSSSANNACFISRPHYRFFSGFPVPLCAYSRMHGNGEVFLSYTVIEE